MDDTSTSADTSPRGIAELLALAVDVTTAAARLAAARRAEGVEVADTKSSLVDVVTHTDREVESFLRARLAELRPGEEVPGLDLQVESGSLAAAAPASAAITGNRACSASHGLSANSRITISIVAATAAVMCNPLTDSRCASPARRIASESSSVIAPTSPVASAAAIPPALPSSRLTI